MKYTETEDVVTIVIDKHDTDDYEGFLGLVKLGLVARACICNLCEEINSAINKPIDPKEQIAKHWDDMFIKFTGDCMDKWLSDSEFAELKRQFYNQIGETPGPVAYAGFSLRKYFKENVSHSAAYQDWIDDCIRYYELSKYWLKEGK